MSELGDRVSEYWFQNYYRVLAVDLGGNEHLLSVDVYRNKWIYKDYSIKCVAEGRYCILYKELDVEEYGKELPGIVVHRILVVGLKAGEIVETVNVRWFIKGGLTYDVVEKIFYKSWEIIGCLGPRDQPWHHGCRE